jgi:hypothetical protein
MAGYARDIMLRIIAHMEFVTKNVTRRHGITLFMHYNLKFKYFGKVDVRQAKTTYAANNRIKPTIT